MFEGIPLSISAHPFDFLQINQKESIFSQYPFMEIL